MYTKIGNLALVSGQSGIYDNFILNNDVRYGRNALDNYKKYIKSYSAPRVESTVSPNDTLDVKIAKTENYIQQLAAQQAQMPPINFRYNYMPIAKKGLVNQQALIACAYEEMGQKLSVPLEYMDSAVNNAGTKNLTMDALDLNRDGNVDIAEYSTSILLADMLDEDGAVSVQNIDGTITNKGENKLLAYSLEQNKDIAYRTYMNLYRGYNLGEATRNFVSNQNNLI